MKTINIVIERANKNYSAYSPDLLGCIATGKTIKETQKNMREAIKMHLKGLIEDGLIISESHTQKEIS